MTEAVAELVRRNVLRTEAAAPQGAPAMLQKARAFLEAAGSEIDSTPSVAFSNSYTAARQALTALMWSMGLRVADRFREHESVMEFGRAAIPATRDLDLTLLDRMRRERHAIEYEPGRGASPARAREAHALAARIVATVEACLSRGRP